MGVVLSRIDFVSSWTTVDYDVLILILIVAVAAAVIPPGIVVAENTRAELQRKDEGE